MIGFSMDDLLGVLQKLMNAFKQLMAWLGVLVLPTEEEKQYYPGHTATTSGPEAQRSPPAPHNYYEIEFF